MLTDDDLNAVETRRQTLLDGLTYENIPSRVRQLVDDCDVLIAEVRRLKARESKAAEILQIVCLAERVDVDVSTPDGAGKPLVAVIGATRLARELALVHGDDGDILGIVARRLLVLIGRTPGMTDEELEHVPR